MLNMLSNKTIIRKYLNKRNMFTNLVFFSNIENIPKAISKLISQWTIR